jgi:drug/metabolite transporter (DMT)-like permease
VRNLVNRVQAAVSADRTNLLLGIAFMVIGMAVLNAMDAISKLLTVDYSGVQVAWARYTFHLLPLALVAGPRGVRRMWHSVDLRSQMLRSVSLTISAVLIIAAFSLMPLADAIAVAFIAPLLIVALSARFLGESVGPHRWIAVMVGFGGMLVLVWPSGNVFEAGTLLAFASAIFWAIGMMMTRHVRRDDPWTTLFHTALGGTVLLSVAVPFFWRDPSWGAWGLMLAMGLLGGAAHTLIILAFRNASASLLAPYNYTLLVWATLYGWLLFDELPTLRVSIGAAIIVAAGLYAWHRERLAESRHRR